MSNFLVEFTKQKNEPESLKVFRDDILIEEDYLLEVIVSFADKQTSIVLDKALSIEEEEGYCKAEVIQIFGNTELGDDITVVARSEDFSFSVNSKMNLQCSFSPNKLDSIFLTKEQDSNVSIQLSYCLI